MMKPNDRIFVAGHRGLVGSAIVRELKKAGYDNLVLKTRSEVDLLNQAQVQDFFKTEKINAVFLAAAKVGGIHANATYPADFLYENLVIASNVIHAAYEFGCENLLFLGSSCIYPKFAPQPIQESALLQGGLEPTNEGYAIAKIAGLKLCEMIYRQYQKRYISAMPTNLYGPGDNFHPTDSHVIPGLMRRFHEAKISKSPSVSVWGTGKVRREFLHCEDLARALVTIMNEYQSAETINVGMGEDIEIGELAALIAQVVGYTGELRFDTSKPDGTPRKLLDISKLKSLGWSPVISIRQGLEDTYAWALEHRAFE